ncbi:zinc ribbon domain-containing protein [Kiritimatiellaeota bacterium B1221]|nr:zinc ribbon domain-containing protein [Kiritimatiellaeota bacterium B1221]
MCKQISRERKTAYYIGGFIMAIGFISFLSAFVSGIINFGNFSNFEGQVRSFGIRAFGGAILVIIGGMVRRIGATGLAGSGVILDTEQAREELEPYSRMAGGMVNDALDEVELKFGASSPEKVIMIKCRECGKLNEEDSKFCQECGKEL